MQKTSLARFVSTLKVGFLEVPPEHVEGKAHPELLGSRLMAFVAAGATSYATWGD